MLTRYFAFVLSASLLALAACGGGSTGSTGAPNICEEGLAPPPGDYCYPCNVSVCACDDGTPGEAFQTCRPDGHGYGPCEVMGSGGGTTTCHSTYGICGSVPSCDACTTHGDRCCNMTGNTATLGVCS